MKIPCVEQVLVVHDYHSVERRGRGINVRQEVFDGDRMVCSSQRYYEYLLRNIIYTIYT